MARFLLYSGSNFGEKQQGNALYGMILTNEKR